MWQKKDRARFEFGLQLAILGISWQQKDQSGRASPYGGKQWGFLATPGKNCFPTPSMAPSYCSYHLQYPLPWISPEQLLYNIQKGFSGLTKKIQQFWNCTGGQSRAIVED